MPVEVSSDAVSEGKGIAEKAADDKTADDETEGNRYNVIRVK